MLPPTQIVCVARGGIVIVGSGFTVMLAMFDIIF
jgi:hypothetical protein